MKRYEHFCSCDGGGPAEEVESPDGEFVRYDDAIFEIERLRTVLRSFTNSRYIRHQHPRRFAAAVEVLGRVDA